MNSQSVEPAKATILIVDDTLDNLHRLSTMLTEQGYEVRVVPAGEKALATAKLSPPDLILLNILMPEMDGYEVCQQLKTSGITRDIPVIFLSALNETVDKVKAFAVGGADYISKPFQVEEILARVENQLRLQTLKKQLTEQNSRLKQEISTRQLLENKLRTSEAEIRAFFDAMNDIVLLINTENYDIKVAPTNSTRFYPKDTDILSQTIEQFFGKQAEVFKSHVRRAVETQQIVNFEYSLRMGDIPVWFTASIAPTSTKTVAWVARDISVRKQVEAALRQSEERFRSLVDNIPGAIYRRACDSKWTMEFLSDAVEEISGYPAGEFIHNRVRSWTDIIHFQDRQIGELTVSKAVAARQPFVLEYRVTDANGSLHWVYEKGQGCFDREGNLLWLDGAIFDISKRKQQEEALQLIVEGTAAKTGREFFRSCVRYLAEVLQVHYAVVTELIDETCTRVRTLAYWIGEDWSDDIEYDLADTPCARVLTGQCCYYSDGVQDCFPNNRKLIKMGAVSYLGMPIVDSAGKVLGHLAVVDIKPMINEANQQLILRIFAARTGAELERKLMEEALQRRAEMDSLLSSISRTFLDQDIDTAINFTLAVIGEYTASDRCYLIRYSDSQNFMTNTHEWCAEGITSLIDDLKRVSTAAYSWFHRQLLNGKIVQISQIADLPPEAAAEKAEFERQSIQSIINVPVIHSKDVVGCIGLDAVRSSKVWNSENINLLKLVGEIVAIALARYDAEVAQKQAAKVAFAANKAKSEFLANMSHELRTPLTAILGLSEALRDEVFGPLTAKQHQKLATIEQSGQHLLELINDVLDLAKIESGKMELQLASTDIQGLCDASLAFVRQQAHQKQIKLNSQIPPRIGKVEVDERRMRQVLINLLSNAVKFTPEGGEVFIEVQADRENESLQFSVVDTGIGIAPENIGKLFQPFMQLDSSFTRRYAGTGLGLALVRQVVELHGGSIALESEICCGSRFTVSLPWKFETEKTTVQLPINRSQSLHLNQVLIVEDSAPAAEQIAHYLSELGTKNSVVHALGTGTVEAALTMNLDAIILDLQLPDRSGWDVLAQLKAEPRTQNIPILIVSVADEPVRREDAGVCEYLVKPFSRHQFQLALRKLVAAQERLIKTTLTPELKSLPLILLAEDNETNISTIVEYLEALGYRIETAMNGIEAVRMTKELKPDLILMDIQMPEMDGLEATREIRADGEVAQIPIIALTSLAMPGDREKCLEVGVNEYLAKPVSLKKLVATISEQINSSKAHSQ